MQCDKPFSPVPLSPTLRWLLYVSLSFFTMSFSDGCSLSTLRRFWKLAGLAAIWSPTALSSLVFLCTADCPVMLTSSTWFFDMILLEYSSHVSSSRSSISLMRSAEHFRKASDSSPRVAALFFNLKLLGLGGESAQRQSKIMLFKAMMSSPSVNDRAYSQCMVATAYCVTPLSTVAGYHVISQKACNRYIMC